jgi:hypothetical protein
VCQVFHSGDKEKSRLDKGHSLEDASGIEKKNVRDYLKGKMY